VREIEFRGEFRQEVLSDHKIGPSLRPRLARSDNRQEHVVPCEVAELQLFDPGRAHSPFSADPEHTQPVGALQFQPESFCFRLRDGRDAGPGIEQHPDLLIIDSTFNDGAISRIDHWKFGNLRDLAGPEGCGGQRHAGQRRHDPKNSASSAALQHKFVMPLPTVKVGPGSRAGVVASRAIAMAVSGVRRRASPPDQVTLSALH
jgi:hypothetical protein